MLDIKFIKDQKDGKYKFIEMNPRTHWANTHSTFCGVNLPYIAYLDSKGLIQGCSILYNQKNAVKWLDFRLDLFSFSAKFLNNQITVREWTKYSN